MKKHWFIQVIESVETAQKRAIGGKSVIIDMGSKDENRKRDFRMRKDVIKILGNTIKELLNVIRKYKLQ